MRILSQKTQQMLQKENHFAVARFGEGQQYGRNCQILWDNAIFFESEVEVYHLFGLLFQNWAVQQKLKFDQHLFV